MEINKLRYTELNPIIKQYPNPEILLGHEIFWTEKRDGSNLGAYLDNDNELQLMSRNMSKASEDFYNLFNLTGRAEMVKCLLYDQKTMWHQDGILYGELITKGKSPARAELNESCDFIPFDFRLREGGEYMNYTYLYQRCYQYELPVVELYGTSKHTTLDSLLAFKDKMLETAKEKGREGVVGKTWENGTKYVYFKEKHDTPMYEKLPREIDDGRPILPQLPDSEILGALQKTLIDLGVERFKQTKEAMPLFAKYVAMENEKHNCINTNKLIGYYLKKLEEVKQSEGSK